MIFNCLVEVSLLTECASFEDFSHRFVISTFLLSKQKVIIICYTWRLWSVWWFERRLSFIITVDADFTIIKALFR